MASTRSCKASKPSGATGEQTARSTAVPAELAAPAMQSTKMQTSQPKPKSKKTPRSAITTLLNDVDEALHCVDHLCASQQYMAAREVKDQFHEAISPSKSFSPVERVTTLGLLVMMTARPYSFENEIWKNVIIGCGGGVLAVLGQELVNAVDAAGDMLSQRSASEIVTTLNQAAEELSEYGREYVFEEALEVLQKRVK